MLDGGPGVDSVSYRQRRATVRVDLAASDGDGERGERDLLTDIESIVGGQAGDLLAGDRAANSLDGARGRDRLIGRGGADHLRSGARNVCGKGRDSVETDSEFAGRHARLGLLERDCESIDPGWESALEAHPVRVTSAGLRYRLRCPVDVAYDDIEFCAGRLQVREHARPRRLLARGRLPKRAWDPGVLVARYTALGRQRALAGRSLKVDMTFAGDRTLVGAGSPATARWTIRLALGR